MQITYANRHEFLRAGGPAETHDHLIAVWAEGMPGDRLERLWFQDRDGVVWTMDWAPIRRDVFETPCKWYRADQAIPDDTVYCGQYYRTRHTPNTF